MSRQWRRKAADRSGGKEKLPQAMEDVCMLLGKSIREPRKNYCKKLFLYDERYAVEFRALRGLGDLRSSNSNLLIEYRERN